MAEKQSNKDRLKEITDSIENGIKELFESRKVQELSSHHEPVPQVQRQ